MFTWRDGHVLAAGVICAIRPRGEVLGSLPVDRSDRRCAASMPAWRATEYLAARTLLRSLLAETAPGYATAVIARRSSGQPYLPGFGHVGISLSHSQDWTAAAVGIGRSVGIDVQVPAQVDPALLDRCCAPTDAAGLAALSPARRNYEFAWIWTAQEACVKATGTGLAGLPWRVPVRARQRRGGWRGLTWVMLRRPMAVPASCAYGSMLAGG